jgi:chromate reductase, NAD(P)H dehydrogenase (quinone)
MMFIGLSPDLTLPAHIRTPIVHIMLLFRSPSRMPPPKILAFAGSLRAGSYNKKLVQIAAQGARDAGAEVTYIDLRDFPLPVFDEDLESKEGIVPNAKKLKEIFTAHHGMLISCPEYNSSISAALKNAIDWLSRPMQGEPPLGPFLEKYCVLMAASPGNLGGLRGLVTVRSILSNIRVTVLPDQIAVVKAHEAFNDDGTLKDPKQHTAVTDLGVKLAKLLQKLRG